MSWNILNDTLLCYTPANTKPICRSVHAFDFDHTLVCQKSGKKFPQDSDDWEYMFECVKETLISASKTNTIVIFTNQAGVEKKKITLEMLKQRLLNFISDIGIDIWVFAALSTDKHRKPNREIWDYAQQLMGINFDIEKSLYVGDAAGRIKSWKPGAKKDFSCSDRKFAFNIGIPFQTPEQYFLGEPELSADLWDWGGYYGAEYIDNNVLSTPSQGIEECNGKEVIILVGPPASGKSTLSIDKFPGYVRINRDILKTKAKCLKQFKLAIGENKNVIVDNTNPDIKSRKEYLDLVPKDYTKRCIVMDVSRELALHLNEYRVWSTNARKIPIVVYRMWYKKYQEPTTNEFDLVEKQQFIPSFRTDVQLQLFSQRS